MILVSFLTLFVIRELFPVLPGDKRSLGILNWESLLLRDGDERKEREINCDSFLILCSVDSFATQEENNSVRGDKLEKKGGHPVRVSDARALYE